MTSQLNTSSEDTAYDLLIIGGGIQGAGVARDAAMRGLKVLLCEQHDFGWATSANSSKLIHGGLRYLERGNLRLVYESLRERRTLLAIAPQLVHPLGFTIPFYRRARRAGWLYQFGLTLYDWLAGHADLPRHRSLTTQELIQRFPFLANAENLQGGAEYFDCQMHDVRLTLVNILDAQKHGADCRNYTTVAALEGDGTTTYRVALDRNGQREWVEAHCIVNAAGPWVDEVLRLGSGVKSPNVSNAKGVHLLFEAPQPLEQALLLEAEGEERIFFILPWGKWWLVGTTDTAYSGSLDEICVTSEDVAYIRRNLERYVEAGTLGRLRLIGSYAGVRPLTYVKGQSTRDISRDYKVSESSHNFWSIVGGKYTVYRHIAEKVVDVVQQRVFGYTPKRCGTHQQRLMGSDYDSTYSNWQTYCEAQKKQLQQTHHFDTATAEHLINNYGTQLPQLLALIADNKELRQRLHPQHPHIAAEIAYAIRYEAAVTLEDFVMRRTDLLHRLHTDETALRNIAQRFSVARGLDADEQARQWQTCETHRRKLASIVWR